jgi:hypothetical protein
VEDGRLNPIGASAGPSTSGAMDEVRLVIPAASEFLRTARLVAADIGARAGLDCEEIEDFRIAVDELCHSTMTATDHHLMLTFVSTADGVIARGVARSRAGCVAPGLTDLSGTIVASVCDRFEFDDEGDVISFFAVKLTRRAMVGRS